MTEGALSDWLTRVLLPAWLKRVHDPAVPGFIETMHADGRPCQDGRRSTLVTARLTYVFSHAHLLGVAGALEAARHGMSFLLTSCRGGEGSFSHRGTVDGDITDGRSDFYDLAFVLFALGWFGRATGEAEAFRIAGEVMDFIEERLAHPAGGYREDTLGTLPRRQNPHMHLLEACHALAESSGDPRWLQQADSIVALMQAKMLDAESGSLGEFFNEDWSPFSGPRGLIREPGHHYEWTWLLHHHARLTGSPDAHATARGLFAFAERVRLASAGPAIVSEVDPQGRVTTGSALLWPQTEYIKALAARAEFEGDGDAIAALDRHLDIIFRRFLDRETGLWVNQLDAAGAAIVADIPVRVLYHLVLACAEVCRVKELLSGSRVS
jgi:mannose/cellobiose epimerase-like protein (N-acyl-D-glucosamine 2-epimerase family)